MVLSTADFSGYTYRNYQVEEDLQATLVLSTEDFSGYIFFCCSIGSIIGMNTEGHVDNSIFGFLYFIDGAATTLVVAQWQIGMTHWASAIFLGSRDCSRWTGGRATHRASETNVSNNVSTTGNVILSLVMRKAHLTASGCTWFAGLPCGGLGCKPSS